MLPPALAKLPSDRRRLSRDFVEQNLRDRMLVGALAVAGRKGLLGATVQDLITAASVSRATFYKYFPDKEACLAAMHGEVLGWLTEEARDAASAPAAWPDAVRSVCERLLGLLVDDPRLARLCAADAMFAEGEIRLRQELALGELAAALRKGREERPWGKSLPDALEPLLVRGATMLVVRAIVHGEEPSAARLTYELPEVILIPYLGSEDARRASRPRR